LLPQLEDDHDIRVVILTGDDAGGAFSAGANIKDPKTHTSDSIAAAIEALPKRRRHQAMNLLSDFAKPLVAAVNGYAVGIGCIVTYCCDLIVASERAEWRLPQVALGILPAQGGTVRLARWIGRGQAMKVAMGFPLKAEEAYRVGLAQWLVPHEELMAKAMEVAEDVAALPPVAPRPALLGTPPAVRERGLNRTFRSGRLAGQLAVGSGRWVAVAQRRLDLGDGGGERGHDIVGGGRDGRLGHREIRPLLAPQPDQQM